MCTNALESNWPLTMGITTRSVPMLLYMTASDDTAGAMVVPVRAMSRVGQVPRVRVGAGRCCREHSVGYKPHSHQ